jgi:putative hemolysin
MLENNVKGAKKVERVISDNRKLFSTILVGSNITNILAPVVATSIAIDIGGNNPLAIGVSTVIITSVVLIYCEMVPKMLAAQNAEKISLAVAGSVAFFMVAFAPFIFVFSFISKLSIRLLGVDPNKANPVMTEDDFKSLINVSHDEGILKVDDREMIFNVFDFKNQHAKDVMTPRTDITALPSHAARGKIADVFKETRFSRIPVYKDNIDKIIGILYFKDFIYAPEGDDFSLENIMQKPFYTYESKHIKELFQQMRSGSVHIAVILDEYGGTAGIVALEDLIEEIVGEITDEYDNPETAFKQTGEREYTVSGGAKIDDVNDALGLKIHSEKFDSLGGYLIENFGSVPEAGQSFEAAGIKFTVEEAQSNKVERIKVELHGDKVV